MMASESCSTSSSSSGNDFVPIFFFASQLGLVSTCLSSGEHILVSVRRVLREGSKTGLRLLFWFMSSAWRKFTQRRMTARWSTTVAVDLPLFARIFLQLFVLDGIERLFGHDQAPSKRLPQQQVSGNLLVFATCASLPRRWIVHSPLFVFFFYKFSHIRAAIEVAEQPPNKRRRNSSFLVNRWKLTPSFRCLSYLLQPKAQRRSFSASPSNSIDCVTHAIRSIVAPFKSHGTVNSREGRHGELTCSTKISRT